MRVDSIKSIDTKQLTYSDFKLSSLTRRCSIQRVGSGVQSKCFFYFSERKAMIFENEECCGKYSLGIIFEFQIVLVSSLQ